MKTNSAKAKGRRLQQLVRDKVLKAFPSLTLKDVQSRAMGSQGTDVVLSEAAFKLFGYAIEVKNQEANKKLLDEFRQATEHSNIEGGKPLLVVSANHSPVLAIMELDVFIDLVKKANEQNKI